jgi:hypothetical protein
VAYVVGSASVEIVPDFRNAQRKITEFYAKQQNEITIPVRPEMSRSAMDDIRRQSEALSRDIERDKASSNQRSAQGALREVQREVAEETRIRLAEEQTRSRAARDFLREDARAQQQIFNDAFKTPARARVKGDEQDTQREAGLLGSLFAAVFSQSVVTNAEREIKARSAFLSAVAAGAVVAGGPAVLAGSVALFAGVGLAATASSREVQETWRSTWDYLKRSSREDAAPFVQVHKDVAGQITEAYNEMRPAIRQAFTDAAPMTREFTAAVLDAARNALPGLVLAVGQSAPVISGLGEGLRSIGTGLGDFFTSLGSHAPALGQTVQLLGQGFGELLPILGNVLGTGSELATLVLPPLNAALGITRDVIDALGPIVPAIATGFATWRIIRSVSGWVSELAESTANSLRNLGQFGTEGGRFTRTAETMAKSADGVALGMGKTAGAASNALAVLPALGVVVAGIATQHQQASSKEDEWAQAILAGGQAASDAYRNYSENTHWGQSIDEATGLSSSWKDATKRADELRAQMTPLQRAQAEAAAAQADLTRAVQEHGRSSDEAKNALARNQEAQAALAGEQRAANEVLRDSISSTDAAAAALEDYNAALRAGDQAGATEALRVYKEESAQAAIEQGLLDDALNGVNSTFGDVPSAAETAREAIAMIGGATGATKEQIDGAIQKIKDWTAELQTVGTSFIDPLQTYEDLLNQKSQAEQRAAQNVADNTASSKDSWRDYVGVTKVTLDEYASKLEEQIRNQENWRVNVTTVSARGGTEVAQILANMGEKGAQITADMATATNADFERMKNDLIREANLGSYGVANEMRQGMLIAEANGRAGGRATASAIANELGIGVADVARIANDYGIKLAEGINPVLAGIGHVTIQTGNFRPSAGVVVRQAQGSVLDAYADGGVENHVAQIAPAGAMRVWAEPETGGEAYIPLSPMKRTRSLDIWKEAGKRLGVEIDHFADGGITWPQLDNIRKRLFPGSVLTSAFRPGANDYHGRAEAIDIGVGGNSQAGLMPIAAKIAQMFPQSTELIHNPNGSIKNGRPVPPGFWGPATWAAHANHVHWAMTPAALNGAGGSGLGTAPVRRVMPPVPNFPYNAIVGSATATSTFAHDQAQKFADDQYARDMASFNAESIAATADSGNSAGYRALGRTIAARMGVGNQFGAIDSIFTRESGWNPNAKNPTSTAYGIPQFLAGTRAQYPGNWSDPAWQIQAGIKYQIDRYGSPNAANAFWNAHHWYHDGGVVQGTPGTDVPAVLRVGETVRTERQEEALAASIDRFRSMVGLPSFAGMGPRGGDLLNGASAGGAQAMNVAGFVNHGTIQLMDINEFTRAAENSKLATLARLGL